MAIRARKVFGTFEKRAPESENNNLHMLRQQASFHEERRHFLQLKRRFEFIRDMTVSLVSQAISHTEVGNIQQQQRQQQ